jgi:hypothetical protein
MERRVVWEVCLPDPGPLSSLLVVGQHAIWDQQNASVYMNTHFILNISFFVKLPGRVGG